MQNVKKGRLLEGATKLYLEKEGHWIVLTIIYENPHLKLFEKSMRTLEEIKRTIAEHKEEIRQKYGIVILGVFGSYARGEQKETSDVDILVELERPVGLEFYEFWDYIEDLLGTKADVLTLTALKQKTPLWEKIKENIVYV